MPDTASPVELVSLAMVIVCLMEWSLALRRTWPYGQEARKIPTWTQTKALIAAAMLVLTLMVATQSVFLFVTILAAATPPAVRTQLQFTQVATSASLVFVEALMLIGGIMVHRLVDLFDRNGEERR